MMNLAMFKWSAAFVVIAASVGSCAREQVMKFDKLEYKINELPQAPQTLTIDAAGHACYESHSNEVTPDHPEIGTYKTILSPTNLMSLERLLLPPPVFKGLPDHWGNVLSGERSRRLRILIGSEWSEKIVGSHAPVDPALREAFDSLDELVRKILSHPIQTLRLELREIRATPDRILVGTLILSNTGVQTAIYRNPRELLTAQDGQMLFEVWPSRPPGAQQPENPVETGIGAVEEISQPSLAKSNSMPLAVLPNEAIVFRIKSAIPIRDGGEYQVRVRYVQMADKIKEQSVVVGEVYSRPLRVNIPQAPD